jgi:hypothetical protein
MFLRFLFVACAIILPSVSQAYDYVVTPPVIELTVEARDLREQEIKISNNGSTPLKIFPTVNAVTTGEDGAIASFLSPSMTDQKTSITSWIAISRARLELAPGETKRIPINFTINPQAVPGDYYAFIGFASGDKRDEAENAVMRGGVPGVMVRLALPDTTTERLRLQKFLAPRYVTGQKESAITYILENTGDTPVVPRGEIILYDVRGEEVGAIPVNLDGQTIAPKSTAEFSAIVPETGEFGRHKAFLNIEYGDKQKANLYDTTYFTVVPLKLLALIFAILLAVSLILTFWYLYRERKHAPLDDESVAMYVRSGALSDTKDHDINLKHK